MLEQVLKQIKKIYGKTDGIQDKAKTKIILCCFLVIFLLAISSFHEKSLDNWIVAISNMVMAFCAFAALIKVNNFFSTLAAKDAYDAAKNVRQEILPAMIRNNIHSILLDIRREFNLLIHYPEKVKKDEILKNINAFNKITKNENYLLLHYMSQLNKQEKIIDDSRKHLEKTLQNEYKDIHDQGITLWRLSNCFNIHLEHTLSDIYTDMFDYNLALSEIDNILNASTLLHKKITEELNK